MSQCPALSRTMQSRGVTVIIAVHAVGTKLGNESDWDGWIIFLGSVEMYLNRLWGA
jgi:hypothetical protein